MNQASAPLVSVVIPCFLSSPEHAVLLDQALRTVEEQTYLHSEITVVDDGSLVDVAAVTSRHRVTHTIRQSNAGCAVARNTGIAASRGECVAFLDSDDHLLPQALEAGVRADLAQVISGAPTRASRLGQRPDRPK